MSKKTHWLFFSTGVWLIVSPWVLGLAELNTVVLNNVIIGLLLVLVSSWSIYR